MLSLSPSRDEYYMVAMGNFLALNRGIQEEQIVPARYRQEFLTIAWEQVHLRSIFPFQYFSIGASLIPFIEHNDANRALMSSNRQRLAVPLSRSEKCIVGTGLERQVALDSRVPAIAKHEGKIVYNDTEKIILFGSGNGLSIPLIIYQRSNKNTCMHQKSQVHKGKCVKKGQILADGAATVGGELALVKNVLVAYMPWEGYNSEDGVLISERLDMPYLQDGRPIDMVFNPLGVPSRMNVRHILECSLGLAGIDDKIHGCSSGPYALVTQQPLKGRAKQGGQRVGKMEVWALEGFGVAHILQEVLTYKSDHIKAHQEVLGTTISGGTIPKLVDATESFRLLVRELRSLALELNHFLVSEKDFQIQRKEV
ncbi:hypothetical protein RYX36_016815 [Vicia faba]